MRGRFATFRTPRSHIVHEPILERRLSKAEQNPGYMLKEVSSPFRIVARKYCYIYLGIIAIFNKIERSGATLRSTDFRRPNLKYDCRPKNPGRLVRRGNIRPRALHCVDELCCECWLTQDSGRHVLRYRSYDWFQGDGNKSEHVSAPIARVLVLFMS